MEKTEPSSEMLEALQLLRDIKDLLTRAEQRDLADREATQRLHRMQSDAERVAREARDVFRK